jgi:hypothetical protein
MKSELPKLACAAALALVCAYADAAESRGGWRDEFEIAKCRLLATGRNPYFILEPGYQIALEDGADRLVITVLDRTRVVGGVTTRVVEEREWKDGKLREISLNYFALCEGSNDVYYFGEDVDIFEDGKPVSHEGSWLAGTAGARAGLMMPGSPKAGMKYYQEVAPGVAMDRAEIVGVNERCRTPAGTVSGCLKIRETSALELLVSDVKYYAPGVGFVGDGSLRIVRHGFAKSP